MGISDDIKPKRRYHSQSHEIFHDFEDLDENNIPVEERENDVAEEQPHRQKDKTELENEFFNNKKNHNKAQNDVSGKKKHGGNKISKVIITLLVLALIVILVVQNLSSIKTLIKKFIFKDGTAATSETKTWDASTDDFYVGETTTGNTASATGETATAPAVQPSEINKASISIELLNGNGIKNSASTVKTQLETAGYKIAKTTNARNFNYTSTIVYYKTDKEAEANLLKEALNDRNVTTEKSDSIVGTLYDVVIVVGAK